MTDAIVEAVTEAVRRELTAQEKALLGALSPQGVAKLNADLIKGVDLEGTMAELAEIYEATLQRREHVKSTLPSGARFILERMSRSPSTDEMLLLKDLPPSSVMDKLSKHLQQSRGESLDDALEDLAVTHLNDQVMFDAQRLANSRGVPVSISRLAPTAICPPCGAEAERKQQQSAGVAPGVAERTTISFKANSVALGLSPIVAWFESAPKVLSPFEKVAAAAVAALSPDSAPRGVLKRRPSCVFPRSGSSSFVGSPTPAAGASYASAESLGLSLSPSCSSELSTASCRLPRQVSFSREVTADDGSVTDLGALEGEQQQQEQEECSASDAEDDTAPPAEMLPTAPSPTSPPCFQESVEAPQTQSWKKELLRRLFGGAPASP
eukprot:RCo027167